MERYILRYTGTGNAPAGDIALITDSDKVRIIDTTGKMVLVEASRPVMHHLLSQLNHWIMSEEKKIPLPDTRAKIKKR